MQREDFAPKLGMHRTASHSAVVAGHFAKERVQPKSFDEYKSLTAQLVSELLDRDYSYNSIRDCNEMDLIHIKFGVMQDAWRHGDDKHMVDAIATFKMYVDDRVREKAQEIKRGHHGK